DVSGAGAAADEADPWLAGDLRVGDRHEAGSAFVAADDQLDVGRLDQRVGDGEVALAGDAIGEVDAVRPQAVDDEAGGGTSGHGRILSSLFVSEGGSCRDGGISRSRRAEPAPGH